MIKSNKKSTKLHRLLLAALALATVHPVNAQSRLDEYIREGLASNQSIKQQRFVLEKSVNALREAEAMFRPQVTFATTYTRADGGRTIDFPTGDLLNGAYATLNQLTGSNAFPQLQNEGILLNPNNFYDARFRTTLPILNAELVYNKRIRQQQVDLQKAEVLLYKRELVKDIKTAYYTYLKAANATRIYESARRLVEEGQRINTRLYENNKVNRTVVIRSQNEVSKISASLITARKTAESARYYVNFLLNRPLTDSLVTDEITTLPLPDQLLAHTVNGREELVKLGIASTINTNLSGLARAYTTPKLGTFLDLGSQAFDWKVNNQSRYYFLAVSLEWNVFSFGKNNYRIKQTLADQDALAAQTDYVQQQLMTELKVRQATMQSTFAHYQAAQFQVKTSQTYYSDLVKMYKEGMAIYIEVLDAQNQWIDAQLQANIALFDTWMANTAIERATASFTISQ